MNVSGQLVVMTVQVTVKTTLDSVLQCLPLLWNFHSWSV
jgi:hypothetical protein